MARQPRPRLTLDIAAIPTYAIGDIHGRYDLLVKAEAAILRDGARLTPFMGFALACAALVIYTHRGNVRRMRAGSEPRARKLWLLGRGK